jgi:hypothetical protein
VKYLCMLAVAASTTFVLATVQPAQASSWIPGSSYMVTVEEAEDLLDDTYDWAYCTGVPRFGYRGSLPDREFRVFDCDLMFKDRSLGTANCDYRYRAVKGSRRGYYRLKPMITPRCVWT